MSRRTPEFEIEIEAMANGGSGLGHWRRQTVLVPYTIPGERLTARIVEEGERHLRAQGVRLIDASADRVYPVCPHFGPGKCGRCHWQHIAYDAQLLIKQDVLADQLSRVGGLRDPEIEAALRPAIASPDEWYYNYHMTLTVTDDGRLGFPGAADGRGIYPIEECHILHADLLALYGQLDLDLTDVRRVRLQMGGDGDRMIILTVTKDEAPALEIDLPASVNLILPDNEPMNLIGDSHARYTIGGRTFRVTAGSYIRANYSQLQNLSRLVESLLDLRGGETVLDLYAGVGVFSAVAAPRAGLVTLIESYPPAVTDADENLADFDNVDVIEGGVDAVLPTLEDRCDAVIIDAPAGLSRDTYDWLGTQAVPRLIHLSDDPALLARDAKRLKQQGYRMTVAQPIDLSPQTYFIDTVALFERG